MRIPVLLFLLAALFLHRPAMLIGNYSDMTTIFPRWEFALLASALILFQWNRLIPLLKSMSRWPVAALLVLLLSALGHFFGNGYWTLESLGLNLIFLTVPLFAALNRNALRQMIPPFMCLVWLIDIVLTLVQWFDGRPLTGIAGNWNWNAALILVSTPFALLLIYRNTKNRGLLRLPCLGVPGLLSAWLFASAGSRAAILALIGAGYVFLLLRRQGRSRRLLLFASLAVLLAGTAVLTLFASARIDSFLRSEIRPVLWESTAAMIADHPFGVGAESFENSYIPYKTAEYFLHRHMAWRTVHPHNEFLNIAACLGIPALLAWCFLTFRGMLLFIRRFRYSPATEKLIFLAFVALLIHGMLDLVFFAWPLDLIAFLFAGFFWPPLMRCSDSNSKFRRIPQLAAAIVLCGVLLSAGLNFLATRLYESARKQYSRQKVIEPFPGMQECRAAALTTAFPEPLYRAVESALLNRKDASHALALAKYFDRTPYRNIGRIHGLKALALASLGRNAEALEEYKLDSANYPYLVLPYIGQMTCLARLGRTAEIPAVEKRLDEIMKIRGLSRSALLKIMQNPELDKPNP